MTSSCVITLRLREPTRLRPYTLPLYPLPVILVMIIASVIIISSFATEILYTSLAFSFIALSFPVHWFLEKYRFLSDNQIDISNRIEPYEEDDRYGDGEGSTPRINLSSRSYRQVEGQEIGDNNDGDLSGLITSRSHYSDLPEKDSTPRDPLSENDRFEREIYASDMPHSRDDVYDQSKYGNDSNAYDVRNPLSSRAKINTRLQPSSTAVHKSGVVGIPSITHSLMRPDGYAHVTTVDTAETVIEASNQLSSEVPLYADVDLNDNDNGDGLEYDT